MRQAIKEELARHVPPIDPALDQAEALLEDFAGFWDEEPSPLERRKLIATRLDRVWQDGGTIVAVRPRQPFVRYFRTMQRLAEQAGCQERATGLSPSFGPHRDSSGACGSARRRDRPLRWRNESLAW